MNQVKQQFTPFYRTIVSNKTFQCSDISYYEKTMKKKLINSDKKKKNILKAKTWSNCYEKWHENAREDIRKTSAEIAAEKMNREVKNKHDYTQYSKLK